MKLRWTRLALQDLDSAQAYIAETRPQAASHVVERIEAAVAGLARYPRMGKPGRVAGTRELVITGTPFIVAYRIALDEAQILAVLHAARTWPDAL